MFPTLVYNIQHNHKPLSFFRNYRGSDWIDHVKMSYGCPTVTIFKNHYYKLDAHHWLDTYTMPYMSSYTGEFSNHINILVGNTKLVTLLPERSRYSITELKQHSTVTIPPDSEWMICPKSKMLYFLCLTEYSL